MTTLDRYVATRVCVGFLFAVLALAALFSVIDFLNEIEKVGTGRYGVAEAFAVLLLELPSKIYDLFPPAALLGTVTALGILAGRNEIVALWSAGISRARLCVPVLGVGAVLVAFMILLGELVAAPLAQQAETRRSIALSGGLAMSTSNGYWARFDSGFLNVRHPISEDELRDLYIYELDGERRMRSFTHARAAVHAEQGWMLQDVVESRFTEQGLATTRVAARPWSDLPESGRIRLALSPPEDLSLADLRRQVASLEQRGESSRRYEAAFWTRVTLPVATMVMMFLAIPFVLSTSRTTKLGQRIAVAGLTGIGFQMLLGTSAQMGLVYGLGAVPSALVPTALALALAFVMIRRAA